jgi:hypothetical protein
VEAGSRGRLEAGESTESSEMGPAGESAGVSEGVLVSELVRSVSFPTIGARMEGDRLATRASELSRAEDSVARFNASSCAMRNASSSSASYRRRDVLPVAGLGGRRLHFTFLALHRSQGPIR